MNIETMIAGARIAIALGAIAFFGLCILILYLRWYYRNPTPTATAAAAGGEGGTPTTSTTPVVQDNKRPKIIAGIGAIIPIVTIILGFWQLDYKWGLPLIGELRVPWLIIGFNLLYIGFSFREVKENEYGVISFFGYMLNTVDNGLRFVPRILCRLIRLPAGQKTVEIGSDAPEGTSASEVSHETEDIIRCPASLMVMFAERSEVTKESLAKIGVIGLPEIGVSGLPYWDGLEKKDDPLNERLKAGLKLTIVVRVARDAAQQFVKRVGSFENAIQQLEKNARGIVDDICTKVTWAYFNLHQEEIADCVLGGLEAFVVDPHHQSKHYTPNPKAQPWGLDIIDAAVQPSALATAIQAKIDDVTTAREEKIAIAIRATAEKRRLATVGVGAARVIKAKGFADAASVRAMNKATDSAAGKFNRAMQAAEEMVKGGNVVFSGENPVAVAAAQIKAAIEAYKPAEPQQPKKGGTGGTV